MSLALLRPAMRTRLEAARAAGKKIIVMEHEHVSLPAPEPNRPEETLDVAIAGRARADEYWVVTECHFEWRSTVEPDDSLESAMERARARASGMRYCDPCGAEHLPGRCLPGDV